ncbi:MAG: hypothetical protein C0475_08240 [Planctomyces sp.]|nr:hypothetical protein [Planctomyces sp.]MBA4120385.1 hypothetical protein [Isosphaera sp.]
MSPQSHASDPGSVGDALTPTPHGNPAGPDAVFPGRVALIQTILAGFRVPLFERVAARCTGGLHVFSGRIPEGSGHTSGAGLRTAQHTLGHNASFLPTPLTLVFQRGVMDWLERTDPDILWCESNPRVVTTRRAVAWMRRRGRPVLGWGMGTMRLSRGFDSLRALALGRLVRSFDAMVCYGSQAKRGYAQFGVNPERIWIAYNAMALRPTRPAPQRPPVTDPAAWRPTVLFVGRINPEKRLDMLLHACAAVEPGRAPRLLIVGDGPSRAADQELASRVYPRAEFLGPKFGPELEPVFESADLFVLPGLGGLAIQQAMSYALPVISGEADGTQHDLLRPGNGWIVPPNDQAALTATLGDALSDPQRLRAMGQEGYRIVRDEINIERMADTVLDALIHTHGRAAGHGPVAAHGGLAGGAPARRV